MNLFVNSLGITTNTLPFVKKLLSIDMSIDFLNPNELLEHEVAKNKLENYL
jgi:hypothetical protein